MGMTDASYKNVAREPIVEPLEDCDLAIRDAVRHDWKRADGSKTLAMKVTLDIVDSRAKCANVDAKPRQIVDYINLEVHPPQAEGKRSTSISKAIGLMKALGFEPTFKDDAGNEVEPRINRNGNKSAPEGASINFNKEFIEAYFDKDADGNESPKFGVWSDLKVRANLKIEENEEFGNKNAVKSYLPLNTNQ
jgi:hypothetical protein